MFDQTNTLTTGIDTSGILKGSLATTSTDGNDTFVGARVDTLLTLNAGDTIDGGAGTDTLTATLSGGLATSSISGVENLVLTDLAAGTVVFSTSSATYISGVQNVKYVQSAGDITLTRIVDAASVTLDNVVDDVTITFADSVLSGASDTFTLNVNGFVLAGGNNGENIDVGSVSNTDGDIETLVINATGAGSDFNDLDSAFTEVSTVTVTGTASVDFGVTAAFASLVSFDSTASTGDVTLLLGADGVSGTSNAKTLNFGGGKDTLDLGVLAPSEIGVLTVNMGAGNDTLDIDDYADATMVLTGGAGTDTLTTAAVVSAANSVGISGFEVLESTGADTTHVLTDYQNSTFTAGIAAGAETDFNAAGDGFTTVTLTAAATGLLKVNYLVDGTVAGGNANSLKIVMDEDTVMAGSIDVAEVEFLTFDSSDGSLSIGDDGVAASTNGDGGLAATDLITLTLLGDNSIDLIGEQASADNFITGATKMTTIDASGMTGTAAVSVDASVSTVAMTATGGTSTGTFTVTTGSGIDTVTAGSGSLVAVTGAGNDTIIGGAKADTITGGLGIDTIDLGASDSASDTVILTNALATSRDIISNFKVGATNGDIIKTDSGTDPDQAIAAASDVQTVTAGGALTITSTAGIVLIDMDLNGTFTDADSLTGVNLLAALGGGITTAAAADVVLFAIDNGTDTGIYVGAAGTSDTGIVAGELSLVAVLVGVSDATTLTHDNFTT